MSNIVPIPTFFTQECVGIVQRELEGIYGFYHPRLLNLRPFINNIFAATLSLGPLVVTGATQLYRSGTLPLLEVRITEELVRNMLSDMVAGNVTVQVLEYHKMGGPAHKGIGLCGDKVVVTGRSALNKLAGGIGFVPGRSRLIYPLRRPKFALLQTSASRTSILTVVYIGAGTFVAIIVLWLITMFREWISPLVSGFSAGIEEILSSAISHVSHSDSAVPAVVSNGDGNLTRVNTVVEGKVHLVLSTLVLRT